MRTIKRAIVLAALGGFAMTVLVGSRAGAAQAEKSAGKTAPQVHFVPNSLKFWTQRDHWTTPYGPAFATIIMKTSNNVACSGGPFALCAYSGAAPMGCKADKAGKFADCKCFEIPTGDYFVNINAILNRKVWAETVKVCGKDGSRCSEHPNLAPACKYVNDHTLIPGADLFSTFSFACADKLPFGHSRCGSGPYAGCMTAPCRRTATPGIVDCSCPIFSGPYELGSNHGNCDAGDGLVWSSAYYPKWPGSFAPKSSMPATPAGANANLCKMP
jgi:hypothetical protein